MNKSIKTVTEYADSISGTEHDPEVASDSDIDGFDFDDMDIDEATIAIHDLTEIGKTVAMNRYNNLSTDQHDASVISVHENGYIDNYYLSNDYFGDTINGSITATISQMLDQKAYDVLTEFVDVASDSSLAENMASVLNEMYNKRYYCDYLNTSMLSSLNTVLVLHESKKLDTDSIAPMVTEYYCTEAVKKVATKKLNLTDAKLVLQDAKEK